MGREMREMRGVRGVREGGMEGMVRGMGRRGRGSEEMGNKDGCAGGLEMVVGLDWKCGWRWRGLLCVSCRLMDGRWENRGKWGGELEGVVEGIPRDQTPSSCLRLAEEGAAMMGEAREEKGQKRDALTSSDRGMRRSRRQRTSSEGSWTCRCSCRSL